MAGQKGETVVVDGGPSLDEIRNVGPGSVLTIRPSASMFDLSPEEFGLKLDAREANRQKLLDWIRASLIDGTPRCFPDAPQRQRTQQGGSWRENPNYDPALHAMQPIADYGRVWTRGGWSKPGLFKAGAEKIWGRLGVVPHWPALPEYERAAVEGRDIKQIILRCILIDAGGNVQAEGVGARRVADDDGDLNKALKMAKKSGAIDAVLSFGGLSEIFSQDVEDMKMEGEAPKKSQSKPKATQDDDAPPQDDPVVPAYLQPVGFGKYSPYTWKELVEGGSEVREKIGQKTAAWCDKPAEVGGGRHSYMDWMIKKIEGSEDASPLDKQRLEYLKTCKKRIEARTDKENDDGNS